MISDPNDSTNIIIEPYNTYLSQGNLKEWTQKLDLSKEVIIKDTTSLQKKEIHFTDLEDEDLLNKSFKENYPGTNVFGHYDNEITNNEFAKGELKNEPIFSPYINQRIYRNNDTQLDSYATNMAIQYEWSYDNNNQPQLAETKPKLFWYSGYASKPRNEDGDALTYNLHHQPVSGEAYFVYNFDKYPVCTPYDIQADVSTDTYTLSPTNKSLYWNSHAPVVGTLDIFNYNAYLGTWFSNTLYGLYWESYLNNIYSVNARIMECYLNLNEVDIFNFGFNDEIFIKDTYWRILNISNYQVGQKASTKVTLIKVVDSLHNCNDCNYVLGYDADGSNVFGQDIYMWCPEDDPNCTPVMIPSVNITGILTNLECCICQGGNPVGSQVIGGVTLYICEAQSGSLPLLIQNQNSNYNILGNPNLKSFISSKIGGITNPLIRGLDNNKYSRPIIPLFSDDIIIKYKTKRTNIPQLEGESHRIVLSGNTVGNTRGYAYPEGDFNSEPLKMPIDVNIVIRVKGIVTVIGGSSTTYPIGTTEAFAYYTGFKSSVDGIIQLGTAGGTSEFSLKEPGALSVCTLYIDVNDNILRFGLDDIETDTERIWALTVELDINKVHNLSTPFNPNWALYQDGLIIQFQNGQYLLWN